MIEQKKAKKECRPKEIGRVKTAAEQDGYLFARQII
jgi:hypothetical protein